MMEPTRTVTMQAIRQTWAVLAVLLMGAPTGAFAQANCRNTAPFEPWLADFKKEAAAKGISQATIAAASPDRKSTRLNSSHTVISYAVFCLKKKTTEKITVRRPS